MKVKIMGYNILYGFHSVNSPLKLDKDRVKYAKEVIKKENPDILILTEACFGGPNYLNIKMDYKNIFNYQYSFFAKLRENSEWGTMLLSKFPLKAKIIKLLDRNAITSIIKIKNKILNLDVIHPSPGSDENERIKYAKPLLKNIKKPYIIAGDFNSLSDEDYYDKSTLIKGLKNFYNNETKTFVEGLLKRKFIPYIKSHGLRDAFDKESRTYTIPTKRYRNGSCSSARLDYFFVSKEIKVDKTYVIKNKLTEKASDHYPICGLFII